MCFDMLHKCGVWVIFYWYVFWSFTLPFLIKAGLFYSIRETSIILKNTSESAVSSQFLKFSPSTRGGGGGGVLS